MEVTASRKVPHRWGQRKKKFGHHPSTTMYLFRDVGRHRKGGDRDTSVLGGLWAEGKTSNWRAYGWSKGFSIGTSGKSPPFPTGELEAADNWADNLAEPNARWFQFPSRFSWSWALVVETPDSNVRLDTGTPRPWSRKRLGREEFAAGRPPGHGTRQARQTRRKGRG